jgi:hypothetical protein
VNATQVAGSAAERGSRLISHNRGLTKLHDQPVQNATCSVTVGPVTQIAPSSTRMAQDSTVTQGRKRGKPKGLKDKQPRSKLHSLSVPNFPFSINFHSSCLPHPPIAPTITSKISSDL